jgi:hypothetical protein
VRFFPIFPSSLPFPFVPFPSFPPSLPKPVRHSYLSPSIRSAFFPPPLPSPFFRSFSSTSISFAPSSHSILVLRSRSPYADAFRSHSYALQLLTPSAILSRLQGRAEITLEDVGETDSLFLDAKSSARGLQERGEGQYLR